MIDRRSKSLSLPALSGVIAVSALALSACGRQPYPEPAATEPPPPPPAPAMMGAPEGPNGAYPPPAYGPAQAEGQPGGYGPPPPPGYGRPGYGAQQPGPPNYGADGYGPPRQPAPGYPAGTLYAPQGAPLGPGTMAPIPNPEPRYRETSGKPYRYRDAEATPRHRSYAAPYGYAPRPARPHHAHAAALAPAHPRAATRAPHGAPTPRPRPAAPAQTPASPPAQAASRPAPPPLTPKAPTAKGDSKAVVPTLRAPSASEHGQGQHKRGRHHPAEVTGNTPSAAPTAEETARLSAFAGALTPVIAARATLKGAGDLKVDQPGDVTLTVPPDFSDGLKSEAAKAGLGERAASARLTASLAGDGYTVQPAQPQVQPIASNQPTTFRWTVTKTDGARGPLRAAVGADLLGGGLRHVDLGGVDAKLTKGVALSPKAIGIGLLVLIGLVVAALLAGGRKPRRAAGAYRPRDNHVNGSTAVNLDSDRRD